MVMSERTRGLLEKAGWSPSRRVDVSKFEKALVAQGYVVSPAAREILERFGGLHVACHMPPDSPGVEYGMHFDPIQVVGDELQAGIIDRCYVERHEERVHEPLVPVGDVTLGHTALVVAPSGKVYGAYGHLLWFLRDDFCEVIDDFCHARFGKVRAVS